MIIKHFLTGAAALALALSASTTAIAQQLSKWKSATELDSNLDKHGCREKLWRPEDNLFDEATLLVTCDIDTVRIDKELRTWFFAANLGDTYYNDNRDHVTATFLEFAAASSLLVHYKATPDLDSIAVIGRIMGRDNYGHPVDHIAFTYGFDRDLYRKTDPEHVARCGIHNISKDPDFHFDLDAACPPK